MKVCAKDFWDRAKTALRVARHCIGLSGDAAAAILRAVADAHPDTFTGLEAD